MFTAWAHYEPLIQCSILLKFEIKLAPQNAISGKIKHGSMKMNWQLSINPIQIERNIPRITQIISAHISFITFLEFGEVEDSDWGGIP